MIILVRNVSFTSKRLLILMGIFFWFASTLSAHANRDIVFSARFYASPGHHILTHFHLYRINPDGSKRTQLTFGKYDDLNPRWSPDGKFILFDRWDVSNESAHLCLISSNDRKVRSLFTGKSPMNDFTWSPKGGKILVLGNLNFEGAMTGTLYLITLPSGNVASIANNTASFSWSPNGRYFAILKPVYKWIHGQYTEVRSSTWVIQSAGGKTLRLNGTANPAWSPDGDKLCLSSFPSGSAEIWNVSSHTKRTIPRKFDEYLWIDSKTIVGERLDNKTGKVDVTVFGSDGREIKQYHIKASINGRIPALSSIPNSPDIILCTYDDSNSTERPLNEYDILNIRTGVFRTFLKDGQFLVWSPHGDRFCTAPSRRLFPYGEKIRRYQRNVWTAPLIVGDIPERFIRLHNKTAANSLLPVSSISECREQIITSRFSWVLECDWR